MELFYATYTERVIYFINDLFFLLAKLILMITSSDRSALFSGINLSRSTVLKEEKLLNVEIKWQSIVILLKSGNENCSVGKILNH